MYHEKFVAVIKHNGKILRDVGGEVRLPFGSEYTVLLKNKNVVDAVANVEVDGEDALQGHGIIVPANQSVEIKGWMHNMSETNKFRFIKKTKEIQNHRGNRPDDGMIRIEYSFEQQFDSKIYLKSISPPMEKTEWPPFFPNYPSDGPSWTYYGSSTSDGTHTKSFNSNSSVVCCYNNSLSEDGITIKGQKIDNGYVYGSIGPLEETKHVIILRLFGERRVGNRVKKVNKVVPTRTRIQCDVCGRKWRSHMQHCGNCGNYLH
jgi:hypothetical protein